MPGISTDVEEHPARRRAGNLVSKLSSLESDRVLNTYIVI